MMIYDNGNYIMGKVQNIKEYIKDNLNNLGEEEQEEPKKILEKLNLYNNDSIIILNYNNNINFNFIEFTKDDLMEK